MRKSKKLLLVCCLLFFFDAIHGQSTPAQDSINNLAFFQAIRSGDLPKLATMLKAGASANSKLNGYSALMAATLNGSIEEMKLLIESGADVNYFNADSISAIWLAVPDPGKTTLLLAKGANAQQRSREGNTVLMKLCGIPGSAGLMQQLMAHGCNPRNAGKANDIMYMAAASGDTAVIGLLLRSGISANDTSSFGDYPINMALNYRCSNVVKMLVDHGANVNASPTHADLPLTIGVTPLMWAAVSNDKPSFYYLLDHGADAKALTPGGYSALMFLASAEADDPDMTRALIAHGAAPAHKALDETDALYHARLKGNTKSVEILEQYISKHK